MEIIDPPVAEQRAGNAPATVAAVVLEVKVPDSGEAQFGPLPTNLASTHTASIPRGLFAERGRRVPCAHVHAGQIWYLQNNREWRAKRQYYEYV